MAVERFDPQIAGATDEGFLPMDQTVEGAWVRYSDYAASEAKREEAEGERDDLIAVGQRHCKTEERAERAETRADQLTQQVQGVVEELEAIRDTGVQGDDAEWIEWAREITDVAVAALLPPTPGTPGGEGIDYLGDLERQADGNENPEITEGIRHAVRWLRHAWGAERGESA